MESYIKENEKLKKDNKILKTIILKLIEENENKLKIMDNYVKDIIFNNEKLK
jgi:hypothetical protein